jgi:hypothetical protein
MSDRLLDTLCWHLAHFLRHFRRTATTPAKPRPPSSPKPATPRPARIRKPDLMMRCFAWLPALAPYWLSELVTDIDTARTDLIALLADPAMLALITATPRLGRTLRPLCRMLGIHPPTLIRLPKPTRKPRPKPPPKPRQPRDRGYTLVGFRNILPHLGLSYGPPAPRRKKSQ